MRTASVLAARARVWAPCAMLRRTLSPGAQGDTPKPLHHTYSASYSLSLSLSLSLSHTHTRTHTHARTHAHTRAHTQNLLRDKDGKLSTGARMGAGFMAGITEALVIVTPFEVVKIRLQQQKVGVSMQHCGYY
jgi:ABC-type nickel/cobalt efflux system permease component RcnA